MVYATAGRDGGKRWHSDYTATNGTLTFPAGQRERTIAVPVRDDNADEPNETFKVSLSNPQNATLWVEAGTATITDDDGNDGGHDGRRLPWR